MENFIETAAGTRIQLDPDEFVFTGKELRRYKYALAKCLAAMQEDAHDSDGYSGREIEACELAAPLVGIEWSWRYGAYDEEIYSMKPNPVEVAEQLQP